VIVDGARAATCTKTVVPSLSRLTGLIESTVPAALEEMTSVSDGASPIDVNREAA